MLLQDKGPTLPYISVSNSKWQFWGLFHSQKDTALAAMPWPYLLLQSDPHLLLAHHIPKIGKGSSLPSDPLV